MSAKKASSGRGKRQSALVPPRLKRLILVFQGRGRTVALVVLAIAVFFGLWYRAWREVGEDVLSSEPYWLTQQDVEITPPAEWIHRDIRAEVFRDASLDRPLSIMDEDLVERIANAFSLHPWVAKVRRVTKHFPAQVRVELDYRRPVLMVQVPGGLLPVDVEGVLLPARGDFSPIEARRYPRLVGVDTTPIGPVGTRWGDARVLDAAEIAAAFGPAWQQLGLDRIVPSALVEVGYGDEYTYELVTKAGTRVSWGRPPGAEMPGELSATDKVARLVEYYKENGTLDGAKEVPQLTAGKPHKASR